jgi:hypothetical protein
MQLGISVIRHYKTKINYIILILHHIDLFFKYYISSLYIMLREKVEYRYCTLFDSV